MFLGHRHRSHILRSALAMQFCETCSVNLEHIERAPRMGLPEDAARAALFFSCEDSRFTTGTELPVDGGFSWG